jgi:hypothetical protein
LRWGAQRQAAACMGLRPTSISRCVCDVRPIDRCGKTGQGKAKPDVKVQRLSKNKERHRRSLPHLM